jgi:hypothetical protein
VTFGYYFFIYSDIKTNVVILRMGSHDTWDSINPTSAVPFQVWQKVYYFLKCQNFKKLKSLLVEFFKNYYLLMPKFHKI